MPTMPLIDSHVHFWAPRTTPRQASPLVKLLGFHRGLLHWTARRVFPRQAVEFFAAPDYLLRDYLPADYARDTANVELRGVVHVEAGWVGRGAMAPVEETRWLESLADPRLLGIIGNADLRLGEAVGEVLAAHRASSRRFRGVRCSLAHHPNPLVLNGADRDGLWRDEAWRRGYAQLAGFDLIAELTLYDHQLEAAVELARDFPGTPLVVSHAATPVGYGGVFAGVGATDKDRQAIARRWRQGIDALAEHANVYLKLSGLAMPCVGFGYQRNPSPDPLQVASDIAPLVEHAVNTLGARRCLFASNFPIDKVSMPWATLYSAFAQSVADRPVAEQRALFHDNAARLYRLSIDESAGTTA